MFSDHDETSPLQVDIYLLTFLETRHVPPDPDFLSGGKIELFVSRIFYPSDCSCTYWMHSPN